LLGGRLIKFIDAREVMLLHTHKVVLKFDENLVALSLLEQVAIFLFMFAYD
jgi:hypothetical protein